MANNRSLSLSAFYIVSILIVGVAVGAVSDYGVWLTYPEGVALQSNYSIDRDEGSEGTGGADGAIVACGVEGNDATWESTMNGGQAYVSVSGGDSCYAEGGDGRNGGWGSAGGNGCCGAGNVTEWGEDGGDGAKGGNGGNAYAYAEGSGDAAALGGCGGKGGSGGRGGDGCVYEQVLTGCGDGGDSAEGGWGGYAFASSATGKAGAMGGAGGEHGYDGRGGKVGSDESDWGEDGNGVVPPEDPGIAVDGGENIQME